VIESQTHCHEPGCNDISKVRQFYAEILGLEVVMDQGWIVTLAAPAKMAPQITIAERVGDGGAGRPDKRAQASAPVLRSRSARPLGNHSCPPIGNRPFVALSDMPRTMRRDSYFHLRLPW
jgi:catechol 2,3-dioxygenase-like lactoylglutathione lyase family enzyme